MTQRRRSASEALKGVEAKEETLPVVPEAPEEDAKAADAAEVDAKQEAPEADAAAAADPETGSGDGDGADSEEVNGAIDAGDLEADEDEEVDEVEALVVITMFNYFDESGAHCSALKGTKVHVDHATAERGVKLGALKVED